MCCTRRKRTFLGADEISCLRAQLPWYLTGLSKSQGCEKMEQQKVEMRGLPVLADVPRWKSAALRQPDRLRRRRCFKKAPLLQYLLEMSGSGASSDLACTYGDMLIIHGIFFSVKKAKDETRRGRKSLCLLFFYSLYFHVVVCIIPPQKWVTRCFLASTSPEAEKPVPPPFRCSRSLS